MKQALTVAHAVDPQLRAALAPLVARWATEDTAFLANVFPLLARGAPVDPATLATWTGRDVAHVEAILRRAPVTRDRSGAITELFGVLIDGGAYDVELENGERLGARCALVAHMVPILVGQAAFVASKADGFPLSVEIHPSGIASYAPAEVVGTIPRRVAAGTSDHACGLCQHFADAQAARSARPADHIVSMETFHATARAVAGLVWGSGSA